MKNNLLKDMLYQYFLTGSFIPSFHIGSRFKVYDSAMLLMERFDRRGLERTIKRYTWHMPKKYRKIIIELISGYFFAERSYSLSDEQLTIVREIPNKVLTIREWNALKIICYSCGAMVLANEFHRKACQRLAHNKGIMGAAIIGKMGLAVANGDYDHLDTMLNKVAFRFLKYCAPRVYFYANDMCKIHMRKVNCEDDFGKIVNGRDIAIIGAAPSDKAYSKSNDEIEVRIGYIGSAEDEKAPDVSYYNVGNAETLFTKDGEYTRFIGELKYVRFKALPEGYESLDLYEKSSNVISYGSSSIPFGGPNMLQLVLYDLLHYNVNTIKVYYMTLWQSEVAFSKSYINAKSNDKKILMAGFVDHDCISNFIYTKSLWEHRYFEADNVLSHILKQTRDEYALEMERIYHFGYYKLMFEKEHGRE